jgi:ABC-type transport system involved in cytochrome c biogenesis permease subunit
MTSIGGTDSLKQPVCITRVAKIASLGIIACLVIFFVSFLYAPVSDVYVLFSFLTGILLTSAAFLQATVRSSTLHPILKFVLLIPILSMFILPSILPRQFFPEHDQQLYWLHDLSMFGTGLCAGVLLFRRRVETFLHLDSRPRV